METELVAVIKVSRGGGRIVVYTGDRKVYLMNASSKADLQIPRRTVKHDTIAFQLFTLGLVWWNVKSVFVAVKRRPAEESDPPDGRGRKSATLRRGNVVPALQSNPGSYHHKVCKFLPPIRQL